MIETGLAQQQTPISAEINTLKTSLESLGVSSRQLVERLTPVLKKSPKDSDFETGGKVPSTESEISSVLRQFNTDVHIVLNRLEKARADLEI